MEVIRTPNGLFLSQSKYILDLLDKVHLAGAKPLSTQAATTTPTRDDPFADVPLYRQIVGTLQYLSFTKLDISYSVNQVCQFMHSPIISDRTAVKRIVKYLKHNVDFGLAIVSSTSLSLHALSDATWAGCKSDRKSQTGYCIYLGGNLISWASKKQSTISRSSTKAEYCSVATTTSKVLWHKSLFLELGIPLTDVVL
ncbi:PREDICTED: uncharacterized protein LOC109114187 [Nelumbo nucifera]|uniref:Uncharacterized protein LOC109114187 n=1 Tax=Nelumbo nucifera TaxID=4432 RepID=A0A1U8Q1S3_NELNU|nr:PREDICTED: uncharacterized protein LOC109114187 [Nelumbo nucifera]